MKLSDLENLLEEVMYSGENKYVKKKSNWDIRNGFDWEEWAPSDDSEYNINIIDQFGGEGQGDTIYYTIALYKNEELITYFRVEGYYDSWNGTDWDNASLNIVAPEKVEVTSWNYVDTTETSINYHNTIIEAGKKV